MNIHFNNTVLTVSAGSTLLELLMKLELPSQPYAIAINRVFIPKPQYAGTLLAAGDSIDLVVATPGG